MKKPGSNTTVVVPTYNGARFLGETFGSIFDQSLSPREVIVVDDASTDGTPELVAEIARSAPLPVRLIQLSRNSGGPARPMNVGIGAASGEFIAVCDQDDVLLPKKIEDQAAVLGSRPDLSFVGGLAAKYDDPSVLILPPYLVRELRGAGRWEDRYSCIAGPAALRLLMIHGNFILGYPGFLFRRRDWEDRGGLDERLKIGSDFDFLCWLCTRGSAAFMPEACYLRREHDSNASKDWVLMHRELWAVKERYHGLARGCREESFVDEQRRSLIATAFRLSQEGYYLEALGLHRLASRLWGWSNAMAYETLKLLPRWVARKARSFR